MSRGFISIGSNIDKEKNIPSAIAALEKHFGKLIVSSIFETEPVGFSGDNFFNLTVGFESELPVKTIAKQLRQIEEDHGRTRDCAKFSARTLDLDLILYGELVISDGRLKIPRDEITRYAFVLEPLAEIAPELHHPVTHIKYADLWAEYDKTNLHQKKIYLS